MGSAPGAAGAPAAGGVGRRASTIYLRSHGCTHPIDYLNLDDEKRSVAGVDLGHLWHDRDLLRAELDALIELYRDGAIKPYIHRFVPFSQAAEAVGELEFGRNRGRVLLRPDDSSATAS